MLSSGARREASKKRPPAGFRVGPYILSPLPTLIKGATIDERAGR